ncbi:hypothetical protein AAHA92_22684 [Salvia divinorum]|uniref:F-box associated beta-propeller type 3 domain-containing protein n=1 Tax=Salvia divinorum TaxID=28513 RepID=A0ABD1GPG8_SALDI
MAARFRRLATSATRCLPLCNFVRSTNCFLGQGIEFVPSHRNVETIWDSTTNKLNTPFAYPSEPIERPPCVSEKKFRSSLSPCLQLWEANICTKPKPDIYVYYRDKVLGSHLAAYSLKDDCTINTMSPKYYIYPPSFLVKHYRFTGASWNGLFHYHYDGVGHALWNPTTSEYKILPKSFVELLPRCTTIRLQSQMWHDHKFDDYKVLHISSVYLEGEEESYGYLDMVFYMELYSLKTNSWKRIPCTEFNYIWGDNNACISDVFYCNASEGILALDFSTESLSSLPYPNARDGHWVISLLEYKGLLSALECFRRKDDKHVLPIPYKYHLWVMIDGSWIRESVFYTRGVQDPFCFSHDGKLLYFESLTNNELVVFDRATGELKHLGVNYNSICLKMISVAKSFVQLNGISHVEEMHDQILKMKTRLNAET